MREVLVGQRYPEHIFVPDNKAYASFFPKAKRLAGPQGTWLLLPRNQTSATILRAHGLAVPCLPLVDYPWPQHPAPFASQKVTAELLVENRAAFVLSSFGCGKTRATLFAIDALRRRGEALRVLVIAPLSVLTQVWGTELFKGFPQIPWRVLYGTKDQRTMRLADLETPLGGVAIINPEGVRTIKQAIMKWRPDVLVIDELSRFRSRSGETWKFVKELRDLTAWCWGLTGSPTPNSPTDAWAQSYLVRGHEPDGYSALSRFEDATTIKIDNFRRKPKNDAAEKVAKILTPSVRFTLDQIVELPPLIERTVHVPLEELATKVYQHIRAFAAVKLDDGEITAVNGGVVIMKLLQVCAGWVYADDGRTRSVPCQPRWDAMLEVVREAEGKVIVFVPWTAPLKAIAAKLNDEGIRAEVIYGEVTVPKRNAIFTRFRTDPTLRVLVAHPKTMAHGLTLTEANTIVWWSPTTSLEMEEQANARIRRPGQTRTQLIVRLEGSAVERGVYRTLRSRETVQRNVLDLLKTPELMEAA